MKYLVVHAYTVEAMAELVQQYINRGFKPQGGVAVAWAFQPENSQTTHSLWLTEYFQAVIQE